MNTSAQAALADAAWRLADQACTAAGLVMRDAHEPDAARRAAAVLSTVWGRHGTEMIDPAMLVAIAHAGNLVTVATSDGEPIGAAAGFCGPPGSPFHSHIVGLLPSVTGRGLGRAVKLYQRAWCLEQGIDAMTWTYDPLVARNAYFNLRRLGARAVRYYADFYGEMGDAINVGQGSDRMLVRWDLTAPPPESGASPSAPDDISDAHAAIADVDGAPSAYSPPTEGAHRVLVAIPREIESLRRTDPALALQWRTRTREALGDLLDHGWTITDFTRSCQYVLHRERTS